MRKWRNFSVFPALYKIFSSSIQYSYKMSNIPIDAESPLETMKENIQRENDQNLESTNVVSSKDYQAFLAKWTALKDFAEQDIYSIKVNLMETPTILILGSMNKKKKRTTEENSSKNFITKLLVGNLSELTNSLCENLINWNHKQNHSLIFRVNAFLSHLRNKNQ